jgi:tetratricopeptide (TPR) repeat protein
LERQALRAPEPELLRAIADQQRKLGRDSGSIESLQRVVELEPANVQAWRELAPLLSSGGRHNDAVAAARRALHLVKDAASHRVLGETLARFAEYTWGRGERAPCRAALKECIELPEVDSSSLALALSVGLEAEPDLAQRAAERLLLTEPADARLHRALARASASRGEWKKAASALELATNITLRHQHRSCPALPASWSTGSATDLLIEWSKALQQDEQLVAAAEAADRALRLGNASNEHRRYAANVHQQAAADQLGRGFADRALPLLQRASELTEQPAEVAFLIALAHRILGHSERAVEAARDCLNFEPLHQGAFRLGKELLEAIEPEGLLSWYDEHAALVGREPEFGLEHAALLLEKKEHEPARRLLRPLIEQDRVGQRAALLLADSYRAAEEWDEEVTALRAASKRSELSAVHRRRLAESLEKLGRLDEAAVVLEHVLGGAGDAEQLVKLAALQVESKRFEDALRSLERVLTLQPEHLVGLRLKSWVLKQLDRAAERITVMQEVAKHDPQAKELEELADLCLGQKRSHEAERALTQWAELYPKDARAHLRCGLVRAQWGDAGEALEALDKAVRLDPNLEIATLRMGELRQQLVQGHLAARRYDEALTQSELWVQRDPKNPDAQHCRAECLQTVGRSLEAIAAWRLVLSEHPGHSPSARMFAAQLAGTGRFDEAELVLAKAVGANRESLELMSTLAQLYVTQRKFEQAEIVARRASGLAPSDVDVLVLLSQIAANTSRTKEAEDHLRHALRVNPNHSEANYTLGKLYLALGRLDLAQLQLEKLVRINSPRAEKLASRLERSAR